MILQHELKNTHSTDWATFSSHLKRYWNEPVEKKRRRLNSEATLRVGIRWRTRSCQPPVCSLNSCKASYFGTTDAVCSLLKWLHKANYTVQRSSTCIETSSTPIDAAFTNVGTALICQRILTTSLHAAAKKPISRHQLWKAYQNL